MSAQTDLEELLLPGEVMEYIVIGNWGWASSKVAETGFNEPDPGIPHAKKGIVLPWHDALPLLQAWGFYGGFGSPECYAVYVYSNLRVFWVTQYDGSTSLSFIPRNPDSGLPIMPGG